MQIECDNCERLFDLPGEGTETKVPCPFCGDINRVPLDDAATPARSDPPPSARNSDAEQSICTLRPAMGRAHPFRFLLLVLVLLGGVGLTIASNTVETVPRWATWPGTLMIIAAVVWWMVWWAATHLWLKLEISNKRTIRQAGIIQRHTTEVLHDHVRSVDIRQSLVQRIFNVGTIGIDSAGQDHIEIVMHNLPRPYDVKKIIDQYRKL